MFLQQNSQMGLFRWTPTSTFVMTVPTVDLGGKEEVGIALI